jgi:6-phosphogluconolactonase (cycloisomerase 2 family)
VYVVNPGDGTISGFSAGESTGALTPLVVSPFTFTSRPTALAIDSAGRFAYVATPGSPDALTTYAIDRQTGALTAVPSSGRPMPSLTVAGEHGALYLYSIVLHPSGRLAYVLGEYDNYMCAVSAVIYTYAVDPSTGTLTQLDVQPQGVGEGWFPAPARVALSASGAFLYSASKGTGGNGCNDDPDNFAALRGFAVRAGGGQLRELAGSPFASRYGEGPASYHYRWMGLRPAGDFLYLTAEDQTMRFKLDPATGAATLLGASPLTFGAAAFSPVGRLYADADEFPAWGLRAFDIQSDTGKMVPGLLYETPSMVDTVAIDSSGRFLYATQPGVFTKDPTGGVPRQAPGAFVSAFAIDSTTGVLRPAPGPPTPVGGYSASQPPSLAIANVK